MRFRKKYLRWKVDYTIDVKITDNGLGILLRDVWKYSSQAQWHNKGKVKSDIKNEYTLVIKKMSSGRRPEYETQTKIH